jgi:hypothetical protein
LYVPYQHAFHDSRVAARYALALQTEEGALKLKQAAARETALLEQLTVYGAKFEETQKLINAQNDIIKSYKEQSEKVRYSAHQNYASMSCHVYDCFCRLPKPSAKRKSRLSNS